MNDSPFPRAFLTPSDPRLFSLVEELLDIHEREREEPCEASEALPFEVAPSGGINKKLTKEHPVGARLSV
jgi:hypothetical protein